MKLFFIALLGFVMLCATLGFLPALGTYLLVWGCRT